MLAPVLRAIIALALAMAPATMANAMPAGTEEATVYSMSGMDDCPSAPAPAPDNRCATYCLAGLPAIAPDTADPQDHGPGLANFSQREIGDGVASPLEPPPPR